MCSQERGVPPPSSSSSPLPSLLHPTPSLPAALQKVGGRRSGGAGLREARGGEHADRRAMTTMLSPKIRQTRRGEFLHPPRLHGNGSPEAAGGDADGIRFFFFSRL